MDNKVKELADKISKYLTECELSKTSWQYPAIIGIMKDYYITARPTTLHEQIAINKQYEKAVEQIWIKKPSQLEINAGMQSALLDEAVDIMLNLINKREEKEKSNGTD